jgi:hypothetical protein
MYDVTMSEHKESSPAENARLAQARRVEHDARIDEFITLFRQYGQTVLNFLSKSVGRDVDPAILARINAQVEPMLRNRMETMVRDHLRTAFFILTGEHISPEETSYRLRFPRRRHYLLRFVTLAFSDLIAYDETLLVTLGNDGKVKKAGQGTSAIFPRTIVDGVSHWLGTALEKSESGKANQAAFRALDRLDVTATLEESDRDLWLRLFAQEDAMKLVCPVLLPLLKPFEYDFDNGRAAMLRLIDTGAGRTLSLTVQMWDALFSRIFGLLMQEVAADKANEKIPPEIAIRVNAVAAKYNLWRKQSGLR